jgi:hypothetical protein
MLFEKELLKKHLSQGFVTNESRMCFCNLCLGFMTQRDIRWHRRLCNGDGIKNKMSIMNDKMQKCVCLCQKVTIYILWYLRPILSKDIAKLIGKLIYTSRYDMTIWYPSTIKSTIKKKHKRKIQKYKKWDLEVL